MRSLPDRRRYTNSRNIAASLVVFALALAIMAVFMSADFQSYAYDLEPGPFADKVAAAADGWHARMEEAGAAQLSQSFADWVAGLHDARFGEEEG